MEIRARWPKERPISTQQLLENGVRCLESRHLTLYTDLPSSDRVDTLPGIFDQMIPLLCDYFGLDRNNYADFHIEGFLIEDFNKFVKSGATRQVPKLQRGYALRCRVWLRNQSSDYYLRHLLLHEGIHAFMGYAFGVWGPPWYREGTAELLATHRWEQGRLTLADFPARPDQETRWGRIEYVQEDLRQGKNRSFHGIVGLMPEDYDANEAYAWSWAFAAFCENNSRYRPAFRQVAWKLTGPHTGIADRFLELLNADVAGPSTTDLRKTLRNDWEDYLRNLDYGYDFSRTKIDDFSSGKSLPPQGVSVPSVRADRGWQNSGVRLERGKTYKISASGRFQIAERPQPWWSEPNGITIRYHLGIPIGTLLGTLLPEDSGTEQGGNIPEGVGFFKPRVIGSGCLWTAPVSGTLYFRINDFVAELEDNIGGANIEIHSVVDSPQ